MFDQLLAIIAPTLLCAAVGFIWARTGTPYPSEFVSRAVMNVGAPCLVISVLGQMQVEWRLLEQVLLVAVIGFVVMLVLGVGVIIACRHRLPTFLPSLLFPNSGNMGLPLCLFAFGELGLALSIGHFMLMMIAHFSLGLFIVSVGQDSLANRLRDILCQPMFYAPLIALAMLAMDWSLPLWLGNTLGLLADFTIPLMLMTLGVSLASLRVHTWRRSLGYSLLRVLGGFLIALVCCEWLGVEGVARGVVLLQAAMPVAVFNYLLAMRYRGDEAEVAGMVIMSTLVSFCLLPVLLLYILPAV